MLITHEPEVAERARRVVRVRDGLIQGDGPASSLHDDRGYLHHPTSHDDDTQEIR